MGIVNAEDLRLTDNEYRNPLRELGLTEQIFNIGLPVELMPTFIRLVLRALLAMTHPESSKLKTLDPSSQERVAGLSRRFSQISERLKVSADMERALGGLREEKSAERSEANILRRSNSILSARRDELSSELDKLSKEKFILEKLSEQIAGNMVYYLRRLSFGRIYRDTRNPLNMKLCGLRETAKILAIYLGPSNRFTKRREVETPPRYSAEVKMAFEALANLGFNDETMALHIIDMDKNGLKVGLKRRYWVLGSVPSSCLERQDFNPNLKNFRRAWLDSYATARFIKPMISPFSFLVTERKEKQLVVYGTDIKKINEGINSDSHKEFSRGKFIAPYFVVRVL